MIASMTITRCIYHLGVYMNLGSVDFAAYKITQIIEIIARFVRELSLPRNMAYSIQQKLGILVEEGFRFRFRTMEEAKSKALPKVPSIPSLDIYCMALILFVLKFDFGLDDRTEIKLSSVALRKNKLLSPTHIFNEPNEKYFVFSDWLELSKRRVYLTVKYCYHLHKRYANTLLEVERSPPSMLRFIEEVSNRAELVNNHLTGTTYQKDENNSGLDDYSSDYTSSNAPSECATDDEQGGTSNNRDILKLSEFIRNDVKLQVSDRNNIDDNGDLKSKERSLLKNTLDLSVSDAPLHNFSLKQIEYNKNDDNQYQNEDKIRSDDAEKFEILLSMYDRKVFCPENLLEEEEDESEGIFKIMEDDAKDFMLSPLEPGSLAPNNYTNVHSNYLSAKNKINSNKLLLTAPISNLPVPNTNSKINIEMLYTRRRYWISHQVEEERDKSVKDGCPKLLNAGLLR